MTTAQLLEIKKIRRELVETGADPFEVAAQAIEQASRYKRQLEDLCQPVHL